MERIGEGGMGLVYRARQRSMDREVALKILSPLLANKPQNVQRFLGEARAAGRLNHPNIVQVHDVNSADGVHYFAMEIINGETCRDMLNRGDQPSLRKSY